MIFCFATYRNVFIHVLLLSENDEGIWPCVLKTPRVSLLLTRARKSLLSLLLWSRDTCKLQTFADDVGQKCSCISPKDRRFRSLLLERLPLKFFNSHEKKIKNVTTKGRAAKPLAMASRNFLAAPKVKVKGQGHLKICVFMSFRISFV